MNGSIVIRRKQGVARRCSLTNITVETTDGDHVSVAVSPDSRSQLRLRVGLATSPGSRYTGLNREEAIQLATHILVIAAELE